MQRTLARRARLGAELPDDRVAFAGGGMRIDGVVAGSMAARAGLAAGDLVTAIDEMPVTSLCELAAALRHAGARESVTLRFLRDGVEHTGDALVEHVPVDAGVELGELAVEGATLRTLRTRAMSPRAMIVFVQGIACETVETFRDDVPLGGLVAGWARAGFDVLRFDKRGVGDSDGGPCTQTDFATELADARAVVEASTREGMPVIVFGHSVGGIIAGELASRLAVAGVIVYGTPVTTWLTCLRDSARRQLALRDASLAEIDAHIASLGELAERGELNGRSAAYHRQLDVFDIAAAWQRVQVPTLVVRGEHDWVVGADEQARIASLPTGPTAIVDVPGLDHLFGAHADRDASLRDYGAGVFEPRIVDVTVEWLSHVPGLID